MTSIDSSRARGPAWWRPAAASALVYVLATAILGRDVLRHLSTGVANDAGDPLLTAAILKWNATHVPLTEAWWQFPIFFPTRDTLTFSEHLLGVSVIATPLEWLTSPLAAYNIVMLLTFPLCALAMYALVYRLTRSAAAAFIAGIAFGFAPYRISQLAHIQMLASFYAPLALLGLHEYVESGRRRWLALYGAGWMLQGAANGYCVVFFSVLVGLWGLWFVVARRRWRALIEIAGTTLVAAIPLAAVLYKYITVHAFHGFVRGVDEIRMFSADVAGVMCAPAPLSVWGWMQVACRPEGALFPGVALFLLFLAGVARVLGWPNDVSVRAHSRPVAIVARVALFAGLVYTVAVVAIAVAGPMAFDIGAIHVSITSIRKAGVTAIVTLTVALVLGPPVRQGVSRSSLLAFYVAAAIATWLLALGPTFIVMGKVTDIAGPFAWLMRLPAADSLRVPARFWLMTVMCLSVVAGMVVAGLLKNRRRGVASIAVVLIGCALFADGAVNGIPSHPGPAALPDERLLAGSRVMFLPVWEDFDVASTYRAVLGGWSSINGYSGYQPVYYLAIAEAVGAEDPALFTPFQRYGPLDVVVPHEAPRLKALVERQPGVAMTASDAMVTQYRLPGISVERGHARGRRLGVTAVSATCATGAESRALDGNLATAWLCPQTADASFTIDLGRGSTVGAVVTELGGFATDYPRRLTVELSDDGHGWREAWTGSTLGPLVWSAMDQPKTLPLTMAFAPAAARFVRLRQTGRDPGYAWGIAELQVYSQ